MFKKEVIKITLTAIVGLIIGVVCACSQSEWMYLWLIPLQAVGIVYSFQYLYKAVAAIFGWVANILSLAVGTANCCGVVIGLFLLVVLVGAVLQVIWIAGLVLMVWSLICAFQQDGKILRLPNTSPSRRKRKTKRGRHPATSDEETDWGDSSWDDDD